MIRQQGLEEWRYKEQAALGEQEFRFQQRSSPVDLASSLAMMMTRYPVKDVLAAPYLMQDYDAELIESTLDRLTPENLLEVYSGPDVTGEQQGKWFKAPYTLDAPHGRCRRPCRRRSLAGGPASPPAPNPYLAGVGPVNLPDAPPRQLIDEPGAELWYSGDDSLGSRRPSGASGCSTPP